MTSDPPAPDPMPVAAYLAAGGKLTAPENAPPRYRAELLRMMAVFVDSQLAGSAGFADVINAAPGVTERIAAARIVLEKADHAERVLKIMAGFGADAGRYATAHPWAERLARNADIGAARHGGDMRLSALHYPLEGWGDAVAMNALMGRAACIQLEDLTEVSYQPLAETFRAILPRERRHAELGAEGLRGLAQDPAARPALAASVAYWRPRIAAVFGDAESRKFGQLRDWGLRRRPNAALLADWRTQTGDTLAACGL